MAYDVQKDQEKLRKEREKREKEILDISFQLKEDHGFNSDSMAFGLKETPNGPALVLRGNMDEKHLKDGWQYSANYLLASDYAQEGLYRMKDGEREFIPIVREESKDMVAKYDTPNDVRNGILSANPQISPEQILIDSTSGRGEIQLVGVLGDIRMPQGLEMRDGMVIDINDYNKSFEVKKVLANETTKEDIVAGSATSNTRTINQAPQMEDVYDHKEQNDSELEGITLEGLMDFDEMRRVYANYERDSAGNVISKVKDESYKTMDTEQITDPMIVARYELAEIWVQAYSEAYEMDEGNDGVVVTKEDFDRSMDAVNRCRGKKLSEIAESLFYVNDGINGVDIVRAVLHFIANPILAQEYEIELDMTPNEAVGVVEKLTEDYLRDKWENLMGDLVKTPEKEDENDMEEGMQRTFPDPMFNPNNKPQQ